MWLRIVLKRRGNVWLRFVLGRNGGGNVWLRIVLFVLFKMSVLKLTHPIYILYNNTSTI